VLNFPVHYIERIATSQPLTHRVLRAKLVINIQHRVCARSGTIEDNRSVSEMSLCRRLFFALSLFAAALIAAPRAHAQTRIGEAVLVKNEVINAATTGHINVGDGVLRDETVQTGTDSAARLVMADSTNLSLGANASLKLDRSVFNDEHSYRDIAIRL